MHSLSVLSGAIFAFAATNIDDIFVLTLFFAQKNLRRWHVVAGQYLGLVSLIAISLVGYFHVDPANASGEKHHNVAEHTHDEEPAHSH